MSGQPYIEIHQLDPSMQTALTLLTTSIGTSGQVLSSNGSSVLWALPPTIPTLYLGNTVQSSSLADVTITGGTLTGGQVLTWNGSAWVNGSSGATVAGSNTQIQFNNSGAFGASADFTWGSNTLTLSSSNNSTITVGAAATSSSNGRALTILGGPGGISSGNGGTVTITGGVPQSGVGGTIGITGGTGSSAQAGGAVTLSGGNGGGTSGSGGALTLSGGAGGVSSGNGGNILIQAGTKGTTGTAGTITLNTKRWFDF